MGREGWGGMGWDGNPFETHSARNVEQGRAESPTPPQANLKPSCWAYLLKKTVERLTNALPLPVKHAFIGGSDPWSGNGELGGGGMTRGTRQRQRRGGKRQGVGWQEQKSSTR